MNFGLLIRERLGKHNILLLSFVIFSWLCLVQYGDCVKKCHSMSDCRDKWQLKDHCCVRKTENVGMCMPHKKKHHLCKNKIQRYGWSQSECGCGENLTCTRIKRKNWAKKLKKWSPERIRKQTPYKYKCKEIPHLPEEMQEYGR